MRSVTIAILLFFFFSCTNKDETNKITPGSSFGEINSISIVIDDNLWNGELGDTLRKKWAAPVDGLPQEEPLFTLNQYPTKIFE